MFFIIWSLRSMQWSFAIYIQTHLIEHLYQWQKIGPLGPKGEPGSVSEKGMLIILQIGHIVCVG